MKNLVICTFNLLNAFYSPIEFEGDYGPEINPYKQEIVEALDFKKGYPPISLQEVGDKSFFIEIHKKAHHLNLSQKEIYATERLIKELGDLNAFYFLDQLPKGFLSLDKHLSSVLEEKNTPLATISSSKIIKGNLEKELINSLFIKESLNYLAPTSKLVKSLQKHSLKDKQLFDKKVLKTLTTKEGQMIIYALYHKSHLVLLNEKGLIKKLNHVKTSFKKLSEPTNRAYLLVKKVEHTSLLFTQECNQEMQTMLTKKFFLPEGQNKKEGCLIFLHPDIWNKKARAATQFSHPRLKEGRLNLVLAKTKDNTPYLLAVFHGNSTDAKDGREILAFIKECFDQLQQQTPSLQLIIGADANTKTEKDIQLLKKEADTLGLNITNSLPTTIKKRIFTVQTSKKGKLFKIQEDYLFTLKKEKGGHFEMKNIQVNFQNHINEELSLPSLENLSDHYPLSCDLELFSD